MIFFIKGGFLAVCFERLKSRAKERRTTVKRKSEILLCVKRKESVVRHSKSEKIEENAKGFLCGAWVISRAFSFVFLNL